MGCTPSTCTSCDSPAVHSPAAALRFREDSRFRRHSNAFHSHPQVESSLPSSLPSPLDLPTDNEGVSIFAHGLSLLTSSSLVSVGVSGSPGNTPAPGEGVFTSPDAKRSKIRKKSSSRIEVHASSSAPVSPCLSPLVSPFSVLDSVPASPLYTPPPQTPPLLILPSASSSSASRLSRLEDGRARDQSPLLKETLLRRVRRERAESDPPPKASSTRRQQSASSTSRSNSSVAGKRGTALVPTPSPRQASEHEPICKSDSVGESSNRIREGRGIEGTVPREGTRSEIEGLNMCRPDDILLFDEQRDSPDSDGYTRDESDDAVDRRHSLPGQEAGTLPLRDECVSERVGVEGISSHSSSPSSLRRPRASDFVRRERRIRGSEHRRASLFAEESVW